MTHLVLHWAATSWADSSGIEEGSGYNTYGPPILVENHLMYKRDIAIVSYPCGYRVWLGSGTTHYSSSHGEGDAHAICESVQSE